MNAVVLLQELFVFIKFTCVVRPLYSVIPLYTMGSFCSDDWKLFWEIVYKHKHHRLKIILMGYWCGLTFYHKRDNTCVCVWRPICCLYMFIWWMLMLFKNYYWFLELFIYLGFDFSPSSTVLADTLLDLRACILNYVCLFLLFNIFFLSV